MVKQGYKQTEIGVIPEDWEVKELGELGDVKMCKRVFQHQTSEYGEIPFFKIGTFGKEPDAYISRKHFEEFKLKFSYPKVGEILISAAGTIGRTVVYNGEESYFQDSNIVWIENREEIISNKLLKYVLEVIKYNTEGGTIQRLYNNILKSTLFVCPPLAEQEAIASALSDADAWIESLEQLIAKKRLIKQGAMQELLTPREDWEVKKLGEVCDVRDGTHDSPKYVENGVKFITSKNIVNNKLDFSDISYITLLDALEINKRSKVDKNDILMSMIGTIGNAVLIDFVPDFCIKNVALLKPKNISAKFLIQMIKSPYFQNLLNSKMDGGIQKFVSLGVLRDLDFNCPKSLSEQERIATILSDMDAELEALEQKLSKARQIKQGMMQELLTGRIRL